MFRYDIFRRRAAQLQAILGIGIDEAKEDLLILFSKASNLSRVELISNPQLFLDPENVDKFEGLFLRRLSGEPIPYITCNVDFFGIQFIVTPDVLIPRADTETLVATLLKKAMGIQGARLLELGIGSGIVSISALKQNHNLTAVATDLSDKAILVAKKNAEVILDLPNRLELLWGDWFLPVTGLFDFIVSNPPYVAEGDAHLEDISIRFEPRIALTSGLDGLRDLTLIIQKSPEYLKSGGWLILEHGFDQSSRVTAAMKDAGFEEIFTNCDLGGRPRVSGGKMPTGGILNR